MEVPVYTPTKAALFPEMGSVPPYIVFYIQPEVATLVNAVLLPKLQIRLALPYARCQRTAGKGGLHTRLDKGQAIINLLYTMLPLDVQCDFLLNLMQVTRIHWRDSTKKKMLH
jgi:hypothetical protein